MWPGYFRFLYQFFLSIASFIYLNYIDYSFWTTALGFFPFIGVLYLSTIVEYEWPDIVSLVIVLIMSWTYIVYIGYGWWELALGFCPFVGSLVYLIIVDYGWLELVVGCLVVIPSFFYFWMKSRLAHWTKQDVQGPYPSIFFGNFSSVIAKTQTPFQLIAQMYDDYAGCRYVGGFRFLKPMLIIRNPKLIKLVLALDFNKFAGRRMLASENSERRKYLRSKLSPLSTDSNLRLMFEQIIECSESLETYFKKKIEGHEKVIECMEPITRFTMNVIGLCFFGLELKSLEEENDDLRRIEQNIVDPTPWKEFIKETMPWLFKILRLNTPNEEVGNYFIQRIEEALVNREKLEENEENKNDDGMHLIHTLISMKENPNPDKWNSIIKSLAAGLEKTSATISYALLELAYAPDVLKKLRKEIWNAMEKCEGILTYDIINEMKYLDMVVKETLRKNPPTGMLVRQAVKNCKLPFTGLIIKKGTFICIPTYAIHNDPLYFPDPEIFNPERFADNEANDDKNPKIYLPFGDGLEDCIGETFALNVTKVAIITILKNYRIEPSDLTSMPFEIDTSSRFILRAAGGVHVTFLRN